MEDADELRRAAERDLQAALERLWYEAETAEQTGLYGWSLEHLYEEAAEHAREQAARLNTPVAEALAQEAQVRLAQVRWLQEFRGLQLACAFVKLLDQLRLLKPERRVMISLDLDRPAESSMYVPAAEAMRIVERQARSFAAEKASEYRDKALRLLEEHDPETAEHELHKALELFALDVEERQRCELLQGTKVTLALERRAQLKALLMEAQKRGDSREAWQLLTEAEKQDPFAPGLDQLRSELVLRTNVYADMLLAHIGDLLRQVRQLAVYDVRLQTLAAKVEAAQTVLCPPDPPSA